VSERVRLGRVTGDLDQPRGADVLHKVRVPAAWLDAGACIELELPRNLACAKCGGGGCDLCERSGAVTLRGRKDPAEIVQVTLPRRGDSAELEASGRGIVLRVPERGGISSAADQPRGMLMLTVITADAADPGIRRTGALSEAEVPAGAAAASAPRSRVVLVVAIVVALWILGLIVLRASGCA
jgi:hypothetical protein